MQSMNTKAYMVIIKGEIRTSEVQSCQYDHLTNKWDVTFRKGKTYSYSCENIEFLKNPVVLNPHMYRFSRNGRDLFGIEAACLFRGSHNTYCHICFEDGQERDYLQSELTVAESCLNQRQAKDVFEYIRQIACLSDIRNEETGEKILAKRLARITFVGKDTALAGYLAPSSQKKKAEKEYIPIFPFGCNNSQYTAVKNAMENQISVIQGPPGTGKTQTILNIIANILMQGKTVQIVSNNNAATEEDVLAVIKTVPGNHVRDHYSQRQIDVIKNEVIPMYVADAENTGIIAPYKNQVKALEKEFQGIDVATVHKFQGKEKDTIIISTVDDEITEFADDPYLINVAVSRAKKKLMLVVSGNEQQREGNITDLIAYIQYHNFEVSESKVYSIFDYLYKQYQEERKEYLKKHKRISEYDSENLMYAFIEDVLADDKYACLNVVSHFQLRMLLKNPALLEEHERKYAMNPATHIDFLIYNRISKKPVLAIEVDGYAFHKEGTDQRSRDALKDHILELYEIPLLRFWTNGSGEKEKMMEKLDEMMDGGNLS